MKRMLNKLKSRRHEEEALRQSEEVEKIQRELQRLWDLQSTSEAKRQVLFEYQFGTKTNLANFRGLDVSDLDKLRIGVFGPTGSGKSCFISTCERVVRNADKGSCPIATSGAEGTVVLEDFLHETFFRLVDTRGFFNYDQAEHCEFNSILSGRLKPGDVIQRKSDDFSFTLDAAVDRKESLFKDQTHGIIMVVNGQDRRLRNGVLREQFAPMRSLMRTSGLSPVTVVTHKDLFQTEEECEDALDYAMSATGCSPNHTYIVANYCTDNPGPKFETEHKIFEILHSALQTAGRYVKIAKQQKRLREDSQMRKAIEDCGRGISVKSHQSLITTASQCSVEVFLKILQEKYEWKDPALTKVLEQLENEDIKTVGVLNKTWKSIDSMLPLEVRRVIDRHLKQIFTTRNQTLQYYAKLVGYLLIPILMVVIFAHVFNS